MTSLTGLLVDLPLLASILLKITIVLGASWSLHLILAKRNPRWRIFLWRCAIAGLLLIPALVPFAYLQVSVTPPPEPVVFAPPESTIEQPIIEMPSLGHAPSVAISAPARISQPEALEISEPSFSLTLWFRANIWIIVSVCWGSIAIILILRLLKGLHQVRQKTQSCLPGPEHLQKLLDRVTEDLCSTKKVTLKYAPDVSTPFLTGLMNPSIILPERMISERYKNRMPAIFAHEVAHLKSQDLIWTLVIRWLEVILWFHPLIWKFRNAHSLACEEVCDAVAADYIGNKESYSNTLANLALEVIGKVQIAGGIPMARSSEILERLQALKQRFHPDSLARRWVILSGIVSLIALATIGGLNLVYAESGANKSATRVLHFPKDRSLGRIMVQNVNTKREIQTFHYWINTPDWLGNDEYIGEARGSVVIPAGKRVKLVVNEGAGGDLSALSRLKPNDLYSLTLARSVNDSCMGYVTNLTGLRELILAGNITDRGIKHISKLKSLEQLYVLAGYIGDRGLAEVVKLPSLKRLYLKQTRITSKGLSLLSERPALEELDLVGGKNIGDAGLVHLANLPSLRYLILGGNFTDAGIAHLRNVPSLKILNLMHLPVTDEGLRHLSGHAGLENLSLSNTEITDRGLVYLKSMPSLKKLSIGKRGQNDQITDAGMVHLAQINSLEYLDLPNNGITDKGLATIANLKNLKHLRVGGSSNSPLTDTALQHVSKLQMLEYLLISGTSFTDAGMEDLAKLTNLRELVLTADLMTNDGLARLKTLKSLERIDLSCKNVTISGLSHLNALTNIRKLKTYGIKQDNSGLDISGLSKLESLSLALGSSRKDGKRVHDPVRDEDLVCLQNLKNLMWFQIGFTKDSTITDSGIAYLRGLTNLTRLSIGSPYLTDNTLASLEKMRQLNSLRITGNFTDNGLRHLEGLKSLQLLKIYSANNFSPVDLKRLKDNLPNLSSFTADQNRQLKNTSRNNPAPSMNSAVAPSFVVKTLDGKDIKLQDYRGKVVVLYFWATWCKPCVAGTPKLKKFYADMKAAFGDNFEMISLSMDDSEHMVRKHVEEYGLIWPQVRIGIQSRISSDYGVNDRAPISFLIGPDGRILLTPEDPQVDTKSFIEKVLKDRKI